MEQENRFVKFCDQGMFSLFCALIFFLPISTALLEWCVALPIVLFFLKRGAILVERYRNGTSHTSRHILQHVFDFFLAFKPISNPLNELMAVFLLVNFVSMILSQYHSVSIAGFFGKVLENTFVYFTFLECINTKKRLKIFLKFFMASAFLVGISGLCQYYTGEDFLRGKSLDDDHRLRSCFRQANDLGAYLVVVIPILFVTVFKRLFVMPDVSEDRGLFLRGRKDFFLTITLLALSVGCLALTFSRGAWLSFGISLLFLGFYSRFFVVMVNFAIWFAVVGLSFMLKQRTEFSGPLSVWQQNNRLVYWEGAIAMILDHPLLGVGVNAYSLARHRYALIKFGGYPHNCYLQMTAETGLIGLISFLWIVVRLFSHSFLNLKQMLHQEDRVLLLGALGGLLGFLVSIFFDTHFYSAQLGTLVWVMMGLVITIPKVVKS